MSRLGVVIVGVNGAVASTLIAGVELMVRGLVPRIGMVTEGGPTEGADSLSSLVDFVPLDKIVFGGWDVRFANVYGPWSARKQGAMTLFFRAIDAGEPIVIYGDGAASRDYTHVEDICRALELALERDVQGGTVLHIASGVETTVQKLADLCRAAAGVPDHPIEHRPRRPGEVERNFASYDLAQEVIGYAPTISREDGIRQTWLWFRDSVFGAR